MAKRGVMGNGWTDGWMDEQVSRSVKNHNFLRFLKGSQMVWRFMTLCSDQWNAGWWDDGTTWRTVASPDLRGRPQCSSCIPTAAEGFGKVLWPSASRGSWTAIIWETITSSLLVRQYRQCSSVDDKVFAVGFGFGLLFPVWIVFLCKGSTNNYQHFVFSSGHSLGR